MCTYVCECMCVWKLQQNEKQLNLKENKGWAKRKKIKRGNHIYYVPQATVKSVFSSIIKKQTNQKKIHKKNV